MTGPVLPEALRGRPFAVGELRDAGLPASRLRHPGLVVPTRSVRSLAPVRSVAERAAAFERALPPDSAFSHTTSARLLDLPLPRSLEAEEVLHVMRDSGRTPIRRRGCVGHRGLESRTVTQAAGRRVVGVADTWCDLGGLVGSGMTVDDLVVAGDAVLTRLRAGDLTPADVLATRCSPRGARSLHAALALVRAGVRSPMESRARLMFQRAGFPEPEVNGVVRDAHGGWLLEGDLVWREQRVIGEYQGADHASITRRSADSSRAGTAQDHGYRVMEVFAEDVFVGSRRRACLGRFALALGLDPAGLRIA